MMQTAGQALAQFREFCADLIDLRDRAVREPSDPGVVWGAAADWIGKRVAGVNRMPGQTLSGIEPEMTYAMAALADETFLTFDWSGRGYWRGHLLETHLFGTRAAGQRVFERIDEILAADSPTRAGMAAIYLLMLGLGFRGRFAGPAGAAAVELRRAGLWAWLGRKNPELLGNRAAGGAAGAMERLIPGAYAHTVSEGVVALLPTPARWWCAAGAVPILWLCASFLVWRGLTGDFMARIAAVESRIKPQAGAHPSGNVGGIPPAGRPR